MNRKDYEWQLNHYRQQIGHIVETLKDTLNSSPMDDIVGIKIQADQLYRAHIVYRYLMGLDEFFPYDEDEDQ